MDFLADILLVAGALGAGFYCFVLSRRLTKFNDLEQGVGGAVALLANQVETLKASLEDARQAADGSGQTLAGLTERAEEVANRLELIMASMHDLPETRPESESAPASPATEQTESAGPMFVRHAKSGGKAAR